MAYTKTDLQTKYNLSEEDVLKTLEASNARLNKRRYSDKEILNGFEVIRGYFNDGHVQDYDQATEMFREAHGDAPRQSITQAELLALAAEKEMSVSFSECLSILQCCGLPDAASYTQEEAEQFLESTSLIKEQGKSYSEVALNFGVDLSEGNSESVVRDAQGQLSQVALNLENMAAAVIDEVAKVKAKEAAGIVAPVLMTHLARELQSDEIRQEFVTLEAHIKEAIGGTEGNGPARMMRVIQERNLKLPSEPNRSALPEGSDNG